MSFLSMTAFVAATSAMMLGGAARVRGHGRGRLPAAGARREAGSGAHGSVLLQAALALVLLFTHTLQEVLTNVGAILTLFAALVSLTIFRVHFGQSTLPKPGPLTLSPPAIHVASAAYMLYFGFRGKTHCGSGSAASSRSRPWRCSCIG
jgi:amino acid transporter